MKTLQVALAVAAVALASGCNKDTSSTASSDRTSGTEMTNYNPPRATAEVTSTNSLTPTSRGPNSPGRVYPDDSAKPKQPDNTGVNERDRSDATMTPGDQGGSDADRDITRKIRRSLTSSDQLSTLAKNIKIITTNGKVTLRGPVNSEEEKKAIATAAEGVAGAGSVDNQLEVKTPNQ
jgi:hyperosmotically inducible protein